MAFSNKKFFVLLIITAIILSLLIFYVTQGQLTFGGFVVNSFFCDCSFNFLITISPPIGGQFTYWPGTPQFANWRLPGSGFWTLGLWSPGGTCLVWVGKVCAPFGFPRGTITPFVGTSL